MNPRKRERLSAEQKAELWKRWKAGQSLQEIGRALGKDHVVVHFVLARHGGIAPAARRRSRRALTLAEREDISRGLASGCSMRTIAQQVRRAPSTVSREVARHGGRASYRASGADQQAWQSAVRPKSCLLATYHHLQELVAGKLLQDWSPQQISGWLKMEYPNEPSLRVSHETIYRSLFIQARGALNEELVKVSGKDTATVVAALSRHVLQLPAALRRSLTWDRGLEMAGHKSFTVATDVKVYFCDPQSPWQRGSNENTNGLLRQYLPKNADLSTFSQEELDAIALRLNTRPRQTLGFRTPADKLQASVASTP
jgi:IS30 family transposase